MTELEAAEATFARCHAITGHGPSPQPAQSGVNPMPRQSARVLAELRDIESEFHAPQPALPNRIAELERGVQAAVSQNQADAAYRDRVRVAELERRIDRQCTTILELLAQLAAMTAERDHALLRMEAAIATSHGLIDAEVQRRIAEAAAIFERAPTVAECGLPSPTTQAECAKQGHQWHDTSTGQICAACMVRRGMQGPLGTVVHVPPFPANALRHQRQPGGLLSTADAGRVRLGGYAPSLPPR